jgi:Ca2+-transporting ATPase
MMGSAPPRVRRTTLPTPCRLVPAADEAAARLGSDPLRGLAAAEAAARLARHGPNEAHPPRRARWWREALEALGEPLVLLLLVTAGLYALVGEPGDALTIVAIVLAVVAVEVATEMRALRAIEALRRLAAPTAEVIRDGRPRVVPAAEVVPGDLVRLAAGGRVPADLTLVTAARLSTDDSTLTGEPGPVEKAAGSLAFAGTAVVAGRGLGLAVATGRGTALGRLAGLAAAAREPRTPLQQQLRDLAGRLTWVAALASVLVPAAGVLLAGRPPAEMLLTGLALAFATIPEELPILVTLVLAVGALRLARRNAIVRRLRAAEALGSITVLATDKTGTLTEGRMRVAALVADGRAIAPGAAEEAAARLLALAVAAGGAGDGAADPTAAALREAAGAAGTAPAARPEEARLLLELPRGGGRRWQGAIHEASGTRRAAVVGAPEAVLAMATREARGQGETPLDGTRRQALLAAAEALAARGSRVLAAAGRTLAHDEPADPAALERGLVLAGLVALEDPPRPEAAGAVAALRQAGVRVVMVTGDHPATARAVADRVGIPAGPVVTGPELAGADAAALARLAGSAAVLARVTPEDKLRVVEALQASGEVVAVTGDGINDAAALRAAAVGVAMGRRGADVAREAADLVLADDDLGTVAAAVEGGRSLADNLRAAVRFYLAAKVALLAAAAAAALAGLPIPFTPVQIVVLELFMDLGASTAFVTLPPAADVMRRPPRDPAAPFLDRGLLAGIATGGLALGAAVLGAYLAAGPRGAPDAARGGAFVAFLVGHVALAAAMRPGAPLRPRGPAWAAWAAAAAGLLAAVALWPALRARLGLSSLTASGGLAAAAAGLAAGAVAAAWSRYNRPPEDDG